MKQRKFKFSRKTVLIISLALIIAIAVGGTAAYIVRTDGSLVNRFTPSKVVVQVNPGANSVTISNIGDVPAYIRASYVLNWMNAEGNVSGEKPTESVSIASGWTASGDIYYYGEVVPVGKEITFITGFTSKINGDFHLSIEVVAEAIQAVGMGSDVDSAIEAWAAAKARPVIGN